MFYKPEKIAVFIDGSNLYASIKALGWNMDYSKLHDWAAGSGRLTRIAYYTAMSDDAEFSPLRPLIDWLDYHGYHMVTKGTKEFVDSQGRRKIKGNMDIEIAVDALQMAAHVDHVVLFSGDGDFRRLVEALQTQGCRVTIVSTIKTSPVMIADELRRQADSFLDLEDLRGVLEKKEKSAPACVQAFKDEIKRAGVKI